MKANSPTKLFVSGGIASLLAAVALAEEAPVEAAPAPAAAEEQAAPAAEAASAYLGVATGPLPQMLAVHLRLPAGEGVLVRNVPPESPAAVAGIVEHDVITRIAGNPITSPEDLREKTLSHQPGDEIEIEVVHLGERVTRKVTLGSRDAIAEAALDINRLMLEGMPQDQVRRVRELIERQLNQGGGLGVIPPMDEAIREMRERMAEVFENGGIDLPNAEGAGVRADATVRVRDGEGSIEMRSRDDNKELTVRGPDDEIIWTGPWDTDQDRAAAPDDIRARVEALNIDHNFQGGGLRLNIMPRKIEPLPAE